MPSLLLDVNLCLWFLLVPYLLNCISNVPASKKPIIAMPATLGIYVYSWIDRVSPADATPICTSHLRGRLACFQLLVPHIETQIPRSVPGRFWCDWRASLVVQNILDKGGGGWDGGRAAEGSMWRRLRQCRFGSR